MNERSMQHESAEMVRDLLRRVMGPAADRQASSLHRTVCLGLSHANQGDMPEHARVALMRQPVARALAVFGLQAPVSLTHLKGLWWVARVDAAHIHDNLEFGSAFCTRVASTEELANRFSDGYAEVTRGPFSTREEAQASLSLG